MFSCVVALFEFLSICLSFFCLLVRLSVSVSVSCFSVTVVCGIFLCAVVLLGMFCVVWSGGEGAVCVCVFLCVRMKALIATLMSVPIIGNRFLYSVSVHMGHHAPT